MKLLVFAVAFLFVAQATCKEFEAFNFDDVSYLDAEVRLNIKQEIAKYLKKIVEKGDEYIQKLQIKSSSIIDELRSTTKKIQFGAELAVNTALKGMEALLKKASDKGISAATCMQGKIEEIRANNASFVTEITKAIDDSTDTIEKTLQNNLGDLRFTIAEYKKLLDSSCNGFFDCGKLIVKFGTKFLKAAKEMGDTVVDFGKTAYSQSKAAGKLITGVAGKYVKDTTGVISGVVKCLKKLIGGKSMPYYIDYQL